MKEPGSLIFFYTETPLHAGSGTALGAVDLPIQRERMSGLPMVQGSGLKGAWREQVRSRCTTQEWEAWGLPLFGREPPRAGSDDTSEDFAGAMSLLDARLLLLPVRTVWGGWAWVTAPMVLERLARDLEVLDESEPSWHRIDVRDDKAWVGSRCVVAKGKSFIVEDLEYESVVAEEVNTLAAWLAKEALPKDPSYEPYRKRLDGQLVVVRDEEFVFLTEHATEVVARIRIDPDTSTVANGALWSEESLPAESLLWSLAFFSAERRRRTDPPLPAEELQKKFHALATQASRIRLGGDRTTGRGLVGVRVREGKGGAK